MCWMRQRARHLHTSIDSADAQEQRAWTSARSRSSTPPSHGRHIAGAPETAYVDHVRVQVKGLDVIPGLRRDLEASVRNIEELHGERDAFKVQGSSSSRRKWK